MRNIPLTPRQGGGVCIDTSGLQIADVIVSTTPAAISRIIRLGTGSPVSHAILYAGNGMVIEAIGEGVLKRTLTAALGEAVLAVAYRHGRVDLANGNAIVGYASRWIGKKYDAAGALGGGARANLGACVIVLGPVLCQVARSGGFNAPDKFYCSELVLEAYRLAGLPLIAGSPGTSDPNQIVQAYHNGTLEYVGHLKA